MRLNRIFFALLLFAVGLHAATSAATEIWYEDNNLGHGGGVPPDFVEKFQRPETFKQATKYINVYVMRIKVLQGMDDAFFTEMLFPYLENNHIKLALNAGGATWAGASPRRQQVFNDEIALLQRLKKLGGKVEYMSLQSILSKPWRGGRGKGGGDVIDFPMEKRVAGAVAFAREARAIFPDVAIGIIDALPAKGLDYKGPYRELADGFKQAGLTLSYIHLDMSFDAPKTGRYGISWNSVREIERYVEIDLGAQFGLFVKSRKAGQISDAAFHAAVMSMLDCYAASGGTPRDYILASWFPHPAKTIPETATGNDFPAMRTVLEFGRHLDQIQRGGDAWSSQMRANDNWRRSCGVTGPN